MSRYGAVFKHLKLARHKVGGTRLNGDTRESRGASPVVSTLNGVTKCAVCGVVNETRAVHLDRHAGKGKGKV